MMNSANLILLALLICTGCMRIKIPPLSGNGWKRTEQAIAFFHLFYFLTNGYCTLSSSKGAYALTLRKVLPSISRSR